MHLVDKYTEENAQTSSVSIYMDVHIHEYIWVMQKNPEIIHYF